MSMCQHDVHIIVKEAYRIQGRLLTRGAQQEHEWTHTVNITILHKLAHVRRLFDCTLLTSQLDMFSPP